MPEIEPAFMAALLVAIGALLWITYYVLVIARMLTGKDRQPQPFHIQTAERFCTIPQHEECKIETRDRVAKVEAALKAAIKEHRDEMERLRLEIKGDLGGIHDRINDVMIAVSKLQGFNR